MAEQKALARAKECSAPDVGNLLTAYCFKRATEDERRLVEAHLLECHCCWREVQRLDAAVHVLETDRSLMQTLTLVEMASAFGISAKLGLPFGGHLWHVIGACAIYAALYVVALLVEVAYKFDQYGRQALMISPVFFVWMWLTAMGGMAVDWKRMAAGKGRGLFYALSIFFGSASVLFAAACLFLPNVAVTRMEMAAYTAQGAYLKTILYFIVLAAIFLVIPFHFVLAMQRESRNGRCQQSLSLLMGDRRAVAPRGAIFLRFWGLTLLLGAMATVSLFLHHNLVSHLLPDPYQNTFTNLLLLRLGLYFALGVECLIFYYWALNELKRECLMVERMKHEAQ